MMELIKDLLGFLVERKKLWMAPIILVLLLFGSLIVLTEGSAVAPFIYTLFLEQHHQTTTNEHPHLKPYCGINSRFGD